MENGLGYARLLPDCLLKLAAALLVLMVAWSYFVRVRNRKLPPGPFPLPIIGNMLQILGVLPNQALAALSLKLGSLMSLYIGSKLVIVISSPDMAREFLKTHDLLFASRPPSIAGNYLLYNSSDIGCAPYGPYWRQMRKVCVLQMLSSKRLDYFRFIREEEVSAMIRSVINTDHPVNIGRSVWTLTYDIICRMAFGRKYSNHDFIANKGFKAMMKETFLLIGHFNIGDYISYLAWMDLQGLNRRLESIHSTQDKFLEKIIDEHVAKKYPNVKQDLLDVLLAASADKDMELQITRDNIKAVIYDMLAAGTDTSSAGIEWTMAELLRNPPVMKALQYELERVVGMGCMVRESDLPRLPYLQAVVRETLRLHPPAPLGILHYSVDACNVLGYEIPRNTRVLVNLWAIGRNPKSWDDPELFLPERFMQGDWVDEKIKSFEWMPFGAGRRRCPGELLGTLLLEFAVAQLVHCFDWRLPDEMIGQELDMSEKCTGLNVRRADKLVAVPTTRFPLVL